MPINMLPKNLNPRQTKTSKILFIPFWFSLSHTFQKGFWLVSFATRIRIAKPTTSVIIENPTLSKSAQLFKPSEAITLCE